MKNPTHKRYRYHASGTAGIAVRGITFVPDAYVYSDVPLLTAADLAANTGIIAETDLPESGTWTLAAGTYATPVDPTGIAVVAGESSAQVTWTDAVDLDIASCEVGVSPAVAGQPFTVADGVGSKTITGMTDGTLYTLTLKSVNGAGTKSAGVAITVTPSDVTPPADVTRLNAVKGAAASQTVTVTWVDPADNVGLHHVEVTVADLTGVAAIGSPFSVNPAVQTLSVTGLTTNTTYRFTVKAVDAAGNKSPGIIAVATPL